MNKEHSYPREEQLIRSSLVLPEKEGFPGMIPEIKYDTVRNVLKGFDTNKPNDPGSVSLADGSTHISLIFFRNAFEAGSDFLASDQDNDGHNFSLYNIYSDFLDEYFVGNEESQGCFNGSVGGMGFITKAFEQEFGSPFKNQFLKLTQTEVGMEKIKTAINNSMSANESKYLYAQRSSWFKRNNPSLKIPYSQPALITGTRFMGTRVPNAAFALEDGAISAYRTLETLWPDLQHHAA